MGSERSYEITLASDPRSIREARRFLDEILAGDGLEPERVALGTLALSELVTNAVVHGDGPVTVRATVGAESLRCEVTDSGLDEPRVRTPDAGRPGGRGLAIVAAIAGRWGTDIDPAAKRRTVWFTLPLAPLA